MEKEILVDIQNVSYRYNAEPVLDNVSLSIARGEFLGIIGPNGSGKTTLLKIILGLLTPTTGHVQLFGKDIGVFTDWTKIGYVHQRAGITAAQFPISVAEVVQMGNTTGTTGATHEALAAVNMTEHKKRLLTELSGGQQQRVFIARALVSRPELLILDEPTVGVDVDSQTKFYELLRRLNTEKKLTMILVSHDIDVVAHEVSTIACINRTLISHGPPKDVMQGDFLKKLYGENIRFIVHGH